MKKRLICVGAIAGALLVAGAAFYFVAVNPHVRMKLDILRCYESFGVEGLGTAAQPFTEYSVADTSFVTVETPHYSFGIPKYFTEAIQDNAEFIVYRAPKGGNEYGESVGLQREGENAFDMAILNQQALSEGKKRKLLKGYERLGYGIPDTDYASLKCAFLITEDDYSYVNQNQSEAFVLLVPYRTGSAFFYSTGNSTTYLYETEKMNALISESYHRDWDLYVYYVQFYHPEDLDTPYTAILKTKTPQTAYAILNSISFHE